MSVQNSSIFREKALNAYLRNQHKLVLPRLVAPRMFVYAWLLCAALLIAGLVAWATEVPIFVQGTGIIAQATTPDATGERSLMLVALLPENAITQVESGQRLIVHLDSHDRSSHTVVETVEPQIVGPLTIQKRFDLPPARMVSITRPATVVIARTPALADGLSPETYLGSIYRVEVEVEARSMLAFIPVLRELF